MPPSPFNAVLVPQRRGQHSGGMDWRCTTDVEEYDQAVGDLLRADPVVQTLPLTVLAAIRAGRYPRRLLGWWHEGPTWGAVLHTPPHELIVAALPEPAFGPLVDGLLERGWLPGGVFGATRSAALFAAVWAHRTGCQALLGHYQRLYALDSVRPPPQPNGSADPVRKKDRPVPAPVVGRLRRRGRHASDRPGGPGRPADRRVPCAGLDRPGRLAGVGRGVEPTGRWDGPPRPGLHPARAPAARLCERAHRRRLPASAGLRCPAPGAVHRSGQPPSRALTPISCPSITSSRASSRYRS